MGRIALAALVVLAGGWRGARADDQMRPIAVSGGWIAMIHQASLVSPPDVCLAVNPEAKVGFRSDAETLEIRAWNSDWSLPANLTGTVEVHVQEWAGTFDIDGNNNETIYAGMSPLIAEEMFAAMDKSASMTVKVGKSVRTVSLTGSTKVTNAFRTCAGMKGAPGTAGSNPFQ